MRTTKLRSVVLLLALTSAANAGEPVPARMPTLHGSALNGDAVDFPGSLQGRAAVLVVGFSQGSRADVTSWGKRLADDFHDSSTVRYYEVSVLAGVPRFLRGYVLRKISADVPDGAKPNFVTVEDHAAEWRAVTGYTKDDDAYVLVVDSLGVVRWHLQGPATETSYEALKQHLEALRPAR